MEPEDVAVHPASAGLLAPRWQAAGRRVLTLPGLEGLRPAARSVAAVARPTETVTLRPDPAMAAPPHAGLTVLTANLWHDWPRNRHLEARLEALARLLEREQVDVALLQEVARQSAFRVDEWLGRRLGMAYAYARVNGDTTIGFEEGLAVFSRYSLAEPSLKSLTAAPGFVRRLGLGAVARTPWGDLPLFVVHFSLRRRRNRAQAEVLRAWVEQTAGRETALIGGDFNAHETAAHIGGLRRTWIDAFRALHPTADATTHELRWPWGGVARRQRLDYLFLRPGRTAWQVREARHLATPEIPHSDHLAVLARLEPASV